MKRLLVYLLLAAPGLSATAQPSVTWEKVGRMARDPGFPLSVDASGFMWAAFNEVDSINGQQVFFQGLYRLEAPYDSTVQWRKVSEPVGGSSNWAHAIGRDTVFFQAHQRTHRSIDAGSTWVETDNISGAEQIIDIPAGLAHAHRLVTATRGSLASVSDDRGLTWTPSQYLEYVTVDRIAVVTTGPRAGRLLAGGISGVIASDNGGESWHPTSEWASLQQSTSCIAALQGQAPGGGDRMLTVINDIRIPDDSIRVSWSDDGGESWSRGQALFPGSFRTCIEVVDLGSGRAVAVMKRGPVWWTNDAGETWSRWAEWTDLVTPAEAYVGDPRAQWAFVGPDGRLYIGLSTPGGDLAVHDKRTSEPVASWAVAAATQAETVLGALHVAPNPSRNTVTLSLSGAPGSRQDVLILGITGREIARSVLVSGSTWQIDVSAWAPGLYHARGSGDGSSVKSVPFTVIR